MIIRAFGYEDVYDELGGATSNIHRLENIMTLTTSLHRLFDRLELWFEATVAKSRLLLPHTSELTTPRMFLIRTKYVQVLAPSTRGWAFPPT